MFRKISSLAALFFWPLFVCAQTPEPNQGVKLEMGTDYVKLFDGGNATVPWVRLPLSNRYSAVYSQYQIPSAKTQFFLVEAEFREKLSHVFKKQGSEQVNLDAIQVFARGGFGTRRDDAGSPPSLAYGFHGGASIRAFKVGAADVLVEFKVGLIGSTGKLVPQRFGFNSSPEIAPGLIFRF